MTTRRFPAAALALALLAVFLALPVRSNAADGTTIIFRNGAWVISGQIGVGSGGTGVGSITDRSVPIGRGASPIEFATSGTGGRVLLDNGAGANPSFGALDLADTDARTGTLPFGNGGTGATSFTANRCVRVNSGGTALEVASGDCATPTPPVLSMTSLGTVTQGNTIHIGPGGAVDAAQGRAQQIAPSALSVDNLRCQSSAAPGTSESFTITMGDGACTGALSDSSAQVCTISGTNRSCQEAGAAESVTAGQCFSFKIVASAGAAEAVVNCSAERSA